MFGRIDRRRTPISFRSGTVKSICTAYTYSEFFLRLAIGFYMLIFQPPVNFFSDENIQTIFGTKLEKVVKKIFFSATKASKTGDRQVLVEPTMALLWRPLDVLLFRRPKKYFFHNFFDSLGY
jgi:hypothetical protein